jgi:hypothetical protein
MTIRISLPKDANASNAYLVTFRTHGPEDINKLAQMLYGTRLNAQARAHLEQIERCQELQVKRNFNFPLTVKRK